MKEKLIQFILLIIFGFALAQSPQDLAQKENIDAYIETLENDFTIKKYEFTVKGADKTVLYKYKKKDSEIVSMSRTWNKKNGEYKDTYTYHFIIRNNKRVYYSEGLFYEKYTDKEDYGTWNVQFYLDGKKVLYTTSLGHGKTETDDWDSDLEMEENYNYMLKTVKNFDNKRLSKKNK